MKDFYFGWAMIVGSLAMIVWLLTRFDRLPKNSFVRSLFRWGKGGWSIPASRYGSISGCLLLLVLAAITVDRSSRRVVPAEVWMAALSMCGVFIAVAFVHDYRLHRRTKTASKTPRPKVASPTERRPGSTAIIELFGSTITSISRRGADVVITFSPAWGRVSADEGPNWYQDAKLVLRMATPPASLPTMPWEPWGSELMIDNERYINDFPVPLAVVGEISLLLEGEDEPEYNFFAKGIELQFIGHRREVENNDTPKA